MHRLPSSGHSTPSSPQSPLRSPRLRQGRSKAGKFSSPSGGGGRSLAQRLSWMLLSVLLRRQGIFLFAPLIYIAGMLLYMGTASFDVVPIIKHRPAPGSLYRSPQLYSNLKKDMDSDNSSTDAISTIWRSPYRGGEWKPCVNRSSEGLPESNGYIYVEANGGLNQQRTSVCNAVAVAGYLNATLVIPNFHYHSIWKDPSKFRDIYDEEYFVDILKNDVRVVDKIPEYLMERFGSNMTNVHNFRIKAWSSIQYYRDVVLPKLLEEKVIRISPFANRLSFDAPPVVQRLRCLANYEALRFSRPILTIGESLVERMRERSAVNGGKYVSVHLRFEEDMVAFSCCIFDGGKQVKGSLISSLVLTTLLVITSLFQPHHHNKLVSAQNNTDEGANICIGLQCQIVVDDKTDLFMNQPTARSSRMLAGSPNFITFPTNQADKPPQCPPNQYYGTSSCIGGGDKYTRRPSCNGRPSVTGYCPN